jgi:hypothetical protein
LKNYTVFLEYNIGTVFLLAKFGYMLNLGLFNLGLEGGPGVRASRGSVKLSNDQSEFDDIIKHLVWTDDPVFIDMMMDLTLKLGFSIADNCELVLLTSCMSIPAFLEEPDKSYWYSMHDDLRNSVKADEEWQDEEIIGLLERYRVRLIGPTLSMKLGVIIIY